VTRCESSRRRTHRHAIVGDLEVLSAAEADLVATLCDLIIPPTDAPGTVNVGVTACKDGLREPIGPGRFDGCIHR
jgi:hypothetical protein